MADYKELLRRAVEALPENNGAARRAVYEKARAALVGQLRAINPPLAARDITAHRLQLEDCIRQVEQEASEAVIAGMGQAHQEPRRSAPPPPPAPAFVDAPKARAAASRPEPKPVAAPIVSPKQADPASIEAIIAAADLTEMEPTPIAARANPANKIVPKAQPPVPAEIEEDEAPEEEPVTPPVPLRNGGKPVPSIVARAEAAKGRPATTVFAIPSDKPYDAGRRGPSFEPRRDAVALNGGQAAMRKPDVEPGYAEPEAVSPAMSSVREVEVEQTNSDPQGAIDRAIAALDREARGEKADAEPVAEIAIDRDEVTPVAAPKKGLFSRNKAPDIAPEPPLARKDDKPKREEKAERPEKPSRPEKPARGAKRGRGERGAPVGDAAFPRARQETERGGIGAVTIFLLIFIVLLAGAGGAGVWAWREGYVDLDAMFGRGQVVEEASVPEIEPGTPAPVLEAINDVASTPPVEPPPVLPSQERLPSIPNGSAATAAPNADSPLALAPQAPGATAPNEERLPTDDGAATPADPQVAALPEVSAGSQSLLLEAAESGQTGAVPFSGTVEWSRGTDETGAPTLVGSASIPARNLGVDLLIRRNADPALPASHLMEINFSVTDSFIGGSIAGLPGVLLKNEELVQGTPLIGASARVVGNSFLFALSATPDDTTTNINLLTGRKWMDLALIYATGRRAIITLEKDAEAEALFTDVFDTWADSASAQ
ncbi:hypothetical protein EMQ25_01665 [Arsenicitalea aurantiaca]|uniref:Uncharacterized protein n=1 Tax=Arsenicitalea aurantiaca TaxID=1783274 RepID=A0A433XKT9_9HYPH|nr:hypothetical protein [Arsenicitalea aurantiaca]RUT34696.1 hypothetical protein EMQ25_01665 [Arsenicitalea aurantiaca]